MKSSLLFATCLFLVLAKCHVSPAFADEPAELFKKAQEAFAKGTTAEDYQRAEQLLLRFLEQHPQHEDTVWARGHLASAISRRATLLQEKSKQDTTADHQRRIRGLLQEAGHQWSQQAEQLRQQIKALGFAGSADQRRKLARLRAASLQAQLYVAATSEQIADSYPSNEGTRREYLVKAAKQYGDIYNNYRTRLAGLFAKLYQARCDRKLGDAMQAAGKLLEILRLPDTDSLNGIRYEALRMLLAIWKDQRRWPAIVKQGESWLKKSKPHLPVDEVRISVAEALIAPREVTNEAQQRAQQLAKAVLQKRKSPYAARAQAVLEHLADPPQPAKPSQPEPSFEEDKRLGMETLAKARELEQQLAKQRQQLEEADTNREALQQSMRRLSAELQEQWKKSAFHLERATQAATSKQQLADVPRLRYYLAFSLYRRGDFAATRRVAKALARKYPREKVAPQAMKIALSTLLLDWTTKPREQRFKIVWEVEELATFARKYWPDDPTTAEAERVLSRLRLIDK